MLKSSLWSRLKQWSQQESRVIITSSIVAGCAIALRLTGLLQSSELTAFDQLVRLRPAEPIDKRILIVGINDTDVQSLKQWPMSDALLAELLQKLNALKPRAIGLDIYRDLPVNPGVAEFVKTAKAMPHLIGIELIKEDEKSSAVAAPEILKQQNQIGFNNAIVDSDGKVRRSLFYWYVDQELHTSFALKLALNYLEAKGIKAEEAKVNHNYLQLGKAIFKSFEPNDGGYVQVDANGYQIIANFRNSAAFETVSMTDVLQGRVSPELVRDRVVLIGTTASSLGDVFYKPYTGGFDETPSIYGVELHANFLSQIISSTLGERPLINTWPEPLEMLWVVGWSVIGASFCWRLRSPQKSTVSILLAGIVLTSSAYIALLTGWWIPLVPPMMSLVGSGVVITGYLAHLEEELKRSKDFLQTVINTIADPIFVKDKQHRAIILNDAYCKLIGYPLEKLIEKTDYDIFNENEAEVFWQQDELVFQTGAEQENEEKFTDFRGNIHIISTKRSLHKDAAGNLFLVAVIRDITERKRMEESLKQTAEELMRSNNELKLSEDRLLYLANHDNLTGLPNRKQFYEYLSQAIEASSIHNQLVAVLYLDLDGFKPVNDSLGHDKGDILLRVVAKRLTGCLRGSDTVSRLGGDEFTVILPRIPRIEDAARVAEKILSTLAEPFILEENTVFVTGSIGISIYPLDTTDIDILIKNADAAMYRAKQSGRNRFEIY